MQIAEQPTQRPFAIGWPASGRRAARDLLSKPASWPHRRGRGCLAGPVRRRPARCPPSPSAPASAPGGEASPRPTPPHQGYRARHQPRRQGRRILDEGKGRRRRRAGSRRRFIHFACTSEDINNTSHALMLTRARDQMCCRACARSPKLRDGRGPELTSPCCRTHGQPASRPLGKGVRQRGRAPESRHRRRRGPSSRSPSSTAPPAAAPPVGLSEIDHFACTSEDINNTSHALMLTRARDGGAAAPARDRRQAQRDGRGPG